MESTAARPFRAPARAGRRLPLLTVIRACEYGAGTKTAPWHGRFHPGIWAVPVLTCWGPQSVAFSPSTCRQGAIDHNWHQLLLAFCHFARFSFSFPSLGPSHHSVGAHCSQRRAFCSFRFPSPFTASSRRVPLVTRRLLCSALPVCVCGTSKAAPPAFCSRLAHLHRHPLRPTPIHTRISPFFSYDRLSGLGSLSVIILQLLKLGLQVKAGLGASP